MKKTIFSHEDAAQFFRSLSLLLRGGIGLAEGMYLLAREKTPRKQQLEAMGRELDAGKLLSDALQGSFEQYALGMIRVGEATGRLEESLDALGTFYEERVRTRQKLKNAISYPGMVFMLMLLVVGVLLTQVLPVFDGVYASLGSRLTGIGAGLLQLGMGLKAVLPVLFWLLLAAAVTAVLIWKVEKLRLSFLGYLRRYFGDRGVLRKFNNARFVRGLSRGCPAVCRPRRLWNWRLCCRGISLLRSSGVKRQRHYWKPGNLCPRLWNRRRYCVRLTAGCSPWASAAATKTKCWPKSHWLWKRKRKMPWMLPFPKSSRGWFWRARCWWERSCWR